MGGYGMGGYGLTGMADLGLGSYGMLGSSAGAGGSVPAGQNLHEAAAADPGVVIKTPAAGKKKTRGVRN
jgi:hypothetical protein